MPTVNNRPRRATASKELSPNAAISAARTLARNVDKLDFSDAVPWVYNPLKYAWKMHEQYLERYARSSCEIVFLGMNPGPWGMAQTGVPFGEIPAVRDYLGIEAKVRKPDPEHPKRPITGLDCGRSEVSGRRLWGLFSECFPDPNTFFDKHFVTNYCPLVFMEESARNVTPDKLPAGMRTELEAICDRHLQTLLDVLTPNWVVGVGAFAENCAKRVLQQIQNSDIHIGRILHPSPASPAANRDWAGTAMRQLRELGIWGSEQS
ncbi:MAG: uracil-DNA glycosylase family protein [Aureliella sp.]